ncbi:MAG: class B sortase [Clostridia bacterium]|nr:class B sortase [Clostridia bacterium]
MARVFLNLCNRLLSAFVALALLAMGSYAGYALWDNSQIYTAAENVRADMLLYKPKVGEEESGPTLSELRAINPDVRAWLTLDNTMIDYPVVQGATNFSYLNTDVYGNFSLAGSIFADTRCDPNFGDRYTLIHGHHMAERRMFGDLDLYKDPKFFEENRTGTLILEDRIYSLVTIACLVAPANDEVFFTPERWADDIEEPLSLARETALHADDAMIARLLEENEAADGGRPPQILVLATCSSEYTDARTILLAEMQDYAPAEREDEGV